MNNQGVSLYVCRDTMMKRNDQDRYGSVLLSEAKNLCGLLEILRFAQKDSSHTFLKTYLCKNLQTPALKHIGV